MRARDLASAYAQAIQEEALRPWFAAMRAVAERLRQEPELLLALNDRAVDFGERKRLLEAILPEGLSAEQRNLFLLLLQEGHLGLLDEIISLLREISMPGGILAEVTSAVALTAEQQKAIEAKLVRRYGEGIRVEWRVDPNILGGIIVRVGDEVLDGSVAGRLESLKAALIGSEAAGR